MPREQGRVTVPSWGAPVHHIGHVHTNIDTAFGDSGSDHMGSITSSWMTTQIAPTSLNHQQEKAAIELMRHRNTTNPDRAHRKFYNFLTTTISQSGL